MGSVRKDLDTQNTMCQVYLLIHFWTMFSFYTPRKQKKRFSGIFRGYKMKELARNGLKLYKISKEKKVSMIL